MLLDLPATRVWHMIWPRRKGTCFSSLNYNSFPLSLSSMVVGSSLDLWTKAQSFIQKAQRENQRNHKQRVLLYFFLFLFDYIFFLLFSLGGQMSSSLLFFFFLLVWVSLVTLEREWKEKCWLFGEDEWRKGKFLCLIDLTLFDLHLDFAAF